MSDYGLAIAAERKSMKEKGWQFDSRKKKWTVDPNQNPPHIKLFEKLGGTAFVLNAAASLYTEETLFEIEHHMPFAPKFLCFFYYIDAPAGHADSIGLYAFNSAEMLSNSLALGGEGLFAGVNDTHFYIKHYAETYGGGVGNTTFFGSQYKFRIRFELLNQKAFFLGQKY